jgi:tRNA modification GTPase
MMQNTIAAIATPYGKGAISIIRISGSEAIVKTSKLFPKLNLMTQEPNKIIHSVLTDNHIIIDDVMVVTYKSPKSYTGEDMIEIFCHGGVRVTQNVLNAVLKQHIDLAQPGEFTERAYINKKLDLIQAESVMDLIEAENDLQIQIAQAGLQSKISKKIETYREKIMSWITHIEVNIDYPEYESEHQLTQSYLKPQLIDFMKELKAACHESKKNKLIKKGLKTAIIGKPNVGKSSLLNALIKEDKAIVTEIPGTTRDTVEGYIEIKGIKLHIVDTAGIRESLDTVERLGIEKTRNVIQEAELILFVIDQSQTIDEEEKTLLKSIQNKPHIIVGNKEDLSSNRSGLNVISLSAKTTQNVHRLEEQIALLFDLDTLDSRNLEFLYNERQIHLLDTCYQCLNQALSSSENNLPIDMIQFDLRDAWESLSDITGQRYHDTLVNDMFRRFCLGK